MICSPASRLLASIAFARASPMLGGLSTYPRSMRIAFRAARRGEHEDMVPNSIYSFEDVV
jgi:hypothetical protein